MRKIWLGMMSVLILSALVSVAPATAADEVSVIGEKKESERLIELTVATPAFKEPTKLHVFLPSGYEAEPNKRWPVTYFLAGTQNNYDSLAKFLKGEELTKDYPSIIVSPDGNSGYWSDWYNSGAGGPPKYETFVIDQLIPMIDQRYRTLGGPEQRAIFGISMGGYGVMMLAARHPDLFGQAATLSGAVDSNNPLLATALTISSGFDGGQPDAIYGPRLTEEVRWRGHNPADLAGNLAGMDVMVLGANGILNPAIGEGSKPEDLLSCLVEGGTYAGSVSFHQALDAAGVKHLWKDYGDGCHTPQNFTREVVDTLAAFQAGFAAPKPRSPEFTYRSIEPAFSLWDWTVNADPERALEFMKFEGNPKTIELTGSGMTTVTSPARYKGLKKVDVNGKPVKVDGSGRITFQVDLGAPNTTQQYTIGNSDPASKSERVTFATHAVVKAFTAKRVGRGVKVCARMLGGVIPKAKVKVGKRTIQMRLTEKKKCRVVKMKKKPKPKKVTIKGRDASGHPVSASTRVARA